jgi:hypothetical protein
MGVFFFVFAGGSFLRVRVCVFFGVIGSSEFFMRACKIVRRPSHVSFRVGIAFFWEGVDKCGPKSLSSPNQKVLLNFLSNNHVTTQRTYKWYCSVKNVRPCYVDFKINSIFMKRKAKTVATVWLGCRRSVSNVFFAMFTA